MKIAVIGSGLASVSSCRVLTKNGYKPDVFDTGNDLDQEQYKIKNIIKECVEKNKNEELKILLHKILKQNSSDYPKKKYFGSETLYNYLNKSNKNNPAYSNVLGGFGKVWSASALFPDPKDLTGWPNFSIPNIQTYKKYFSDLEYVSQNDNLKNIFTNLTEKNSTIDHHCSIEKLQNSISKINSENFVSGFSKSFTSTSGDNKCRYCGLCMTGCIYKSIYDPSEDIKKWINQKKIIYFKNFDLIKIIRLDKKFELLFSNGKKFQYDKVFLATGALNSARIVLNSFKKIREARIYHASGFVIPLISLKPYDFNWPKRNTLSQIFLEIKTKEISNWVHCQLSQPNEIVMHKLGFFRIRNKLIQKLYFQIFKRLFTLNIGYHSNYGGYYKIKVNDNISNLIYVKNKYSQKYHDDIYSTLLKKLKFLGFYSSKFLINHGKNADHYYTGGSFPMTKEQSEINHTDDLGQLKDIKGLHIVDSSTFPSIPSTTFGLLSMLNSARITEKVLEQI